ncbi:hypothetical protein CMU89_17010 [Elizabethkingia anophelis]|nr:hypothetical protein [Elizabethkingia anophelis]MDV3544341.1 hypothetical protein [Elizabethkingia anophelis]
MENKLIQMTTFVLEQAKSPIHRVDVAFNCIKYAKFLSQPLTLGMFVPVDENGVLLEEPTSIKWVYGCEQYFEQDKAWKEYNKACERVLFEGFYKEFNTVMSPQGGYLDVEGLKNRNIETIIGAELTLTATAIKSIYGS